MDVLSALYAGDRAERKTYAAICTGTRNIEIFLSICNVRGRARDIRMRTTDTLRHFHMHSDRSLLRQRITVKMLPARILLDSLGNDKADDART